MKFFLMFVILATFSLAFAKEEWQIKSNMSLNLTQSYYSDSWSGGEMGSINWVFNSNTTAEKQLAKILNNSNSLKLSFGQTHNSYKITNSDGKNEIKWAKPVKSSDLIDFESIFRFTLGVFVDPYASVRLESQFFDNSVSDDTKYFNPMTFTESAGIAKMFIDEKKHKFGTRLGAGFREFVNAHADETPVDGGIISVTDYYTLILDEKISFTSKLTLYQALFNSESDALDEQDIEWDALDVDFENIFTTSITKYLNVNLFLQFRYDKEENEDVQIKETLGLGLTYNLY